MKTSQRLMVALVTTALVCLCILAPRFALAQEEDVDAEMISAVEDVVSEAGDTDDGTGQLVALAEEGTDQEDLAPDDSGDIQNLSAQDDSTSGVIELEPSSSAYDDARNLQSALNEAQYSTGEGQFKVVLKPGTYELGYGLTIYSNTELILEEGAVIKRAADSNGNSLFNVGYEAGAASGYETASNVTITGGVWDNSNHQEGKVLHFEQCHDIVIQDATFQHSRTDHVILFDGVKDAQVLGCTLVDCIAATSIHADSRYVNEAIHIDSTLGDAANDNVGHKNGLPCRGITVDGCTFNGVCCAVRFHGIYCGQHRGLDRREQHVRRHRQGVFRAPQWLQGLCHRRQFRE